MNGMMTAHLPAIEKQQLPNAPNHLMSEKGIM
jgi:hypothetical protein